MKAKNEHDRLVSKVPDALSALLDVDRDELGVRVEDPTGADLVVDGLGKIFVIEFKMTTSAATVAAAVKQAVEFAGRVGSGTIPLVAVPYMGAVGRRACEDAKVAWMDLSGNARIIASGLRIIVDGQPNRFKSAGRPANVFAPKSARVTRWFLMHPHRPFAQVEIAHATGMYEGFVSRIVSRLENEGYLDRFESEDGGYGMPVGDGDGFGFGEYGEGSPDGDGYGDGRPKAKSLLVVRDPDLLLDAWRASYRFSKHTIIRGHVAARSGDALLKAVGDAFSKHGVEHAATGLAAAWVLDRFAAFRLATFYLPSDPPREALDELGFREEAKGANLWLVVPNDDGVFHGAAEKDGVRCVHPVQVYLDLKDQPERSKEAAEQLRADLLNWRRDA